MTTSSQCNTGRTCLSLPIITRENTSLPIHVVQKITIMHAQKNRKIRGLKFDTLYWRHMAAYRKICTLALLYAFGTIGTNLTVFCDTL